MDWRESLNEWWPWRTKVLTPQSQEAAEAAFEAGWQRGLAAMEMGRRLMGEGWREVVGSDAVYLDERGPVTLPDGTEHKNVDGTWYRRTTRDQASS